MAAAVDVVPRSIASQYAGIAFPLPLMCWTLRGKPIRSALRKDADHGRRVGTVDIILAQYRPGNLGYRRNIPHIPSGAGARSRITRDGDLGAVCSRLATSSPSGCTGLGIA